MRVYGLSAITSAHINRTRLKAIIIQAPIRTTVVPGFDARSSLHIGAQPVG